MYLHSDSSSLTYFFCNERTGMFIVPAVQLFPTVIQSLHCSYFPMNSGAIFWASEQLGRSIIGEFAHRSQKGAGAESTGAKHETKTKIVCSSVREPPFCLTVCVKLTLVVVVYYISRHMYIIINWVCCRPTSSKVNS